MIAFRYEPWINEPAACHTPYDIYFPKLRITFIKHSGLLIHACIPQFSMPAALRLSNLFELFANSKRLLTVENHQR